MPDSHRAPAARNLVLGGLTEKKAIAHLTEDGRVHGLGDHLNGTARLAEGFAAEFGCGEWGRLLALWHDLGKYSKEFQEYIRAASGFDDHTDKRPGRVDHSAAGAIHAITKYDKQGRILAYCIAGHHAGLTDWQSEKAGMGSLV